MNDWKKTTENKETAWLKKNILSGEITEVSANGYSTFISDNNLRFSVPPKLGEQFSLYVGQKLKIEPKEDNPLHIKYIFVD